MEIGDWEEIVGCEGGETPAAVAAPFLGVLKAGLEQPGVGEAVPACSPREWDWLRSTVPSSPNPSRIL